MDLGPMTSMLMPPPSPVARVDAPPPAMQSTTPQGVPPQFSSMLSPQPADFDVNQINKPAASPAEFEQRKAGWQALADKFTSDPNLMRSLAFFGAALAQPVQPGQSAIGHLAQAGVTGVSAFEAGKYATQQHDLAMAEEQRKKEATASTTALQGAQAAEATQRTSDAAAQAPYNQRRSEAQAKEAEARAKKEGAQARVAEMTREVFDTLGPQEKKDFVTKTGQFSQHASTSSFAQQRDTWSEFYDKLPTDSPLKAGKTKEEFVIERLSAAKAGDAAKQLSDYIKAMDTAGEQPDPEIVSSLSNIIKLNAQSRSGGKPGTPAPAKPGAVPSPKTQAEYDALAPGTVYLAPNGQQYTKGKTKEAKK